MTEVVGTSSYDYKTALPYMWQRLEGMLPDEATEQIKKGWVEIYAGAAAVQTRHPRIRGNWLERRIAGARHRSQPEGFRKRTHTLAIGRLPTDATFLAATKFKDMPARLLINDNTFTPIQPVDGRTEPIRYTRAVFHTGVFVEYGKGHPAGFGFNMLRMNGLKPISAIRAEYVPPTISASSQSASDFLLNHHLPPIDPGWDDMAAVQLLDYCIDLALKEAADTGQQS